MEIIINNFKIVQSIDPERYDLHRFKTIKSGKREGERVEVIEAYGMKLPRTIQYIINYTVDEENDSGNLEEFLVAYEKTSNNILEKLEEILKK